MFGFFEKKPAGNAKKTTLVLSGLHCTSCAVDIDLTLEDLPGITNSKTNYARSLATVYFEPDKINVQQIIEQIHKLGYTAGESS